MKGQSIIFEEVLLFGISVAIFIVAFTIFQMYQMNFSSNSLSDHTRSVRDMVLGHVVELTRIGDLNASLTLRIPREMSGEYYHIYINNTNFWVITDETKTTASYSIESMSSTYSFSGETASRMGEIIIYKRGYNIIID
ncbi:MAG: hypothetical protein JSV63_00660 [Candidatus Aenigmatarchaeota archaeon]|nr:MAG: hypothetical protein JSV63_00660 [Candidatus Aenigmarchaeota archaeon]